MKKIILSLSLLTITGLSYGLVGDVIRGAGEVAGETVTRTTEFAGDVVDAPFRGSRVRAERIRPVEEPVVKPARLTPATGETEAAIGYEVKTYEPGYQAPKEATEGVVGYQVGSPAAIGYQVSDDKVGSPAAIGYQVSDVENEKDADLDDDLELPED